jgi:hypothetical protein
MSMIVRNPNADAARKYDFASGETLGEEIREALKDGDGRAVVITQKIAAKIENFFDRNWHGTTIDRDELFAYANSDVQKFFSVSDDGGYDANQGMMNAILSSQLGVTVASDAGALAAQILNDNNDGDDVFIVNPAGAGEKAENRALLARALLNYDDAGEARSRESQIQMTASTAREIAQLRDVFSYPANNSQNLRVLKEFVSQMAKGEAKAILTRFVASLD